MHFCQWCRPRIDGAARLVVSSCITKRKNKQGNRPSDFSQSIRELLEPACQAALKSEMDEFRQLLKKQKCCLFLRRIRPADADTVPTHATNTKHHVCAKNAQENRVTRAVSFLHMLLLYVCVCVCVCVKLLNVLPESQWSDRVEI